MQFDQSYKQNKTFAKDKCAEGKSGDDIQQENYKTLHKALVFIHFSIMATRKACESNSVTTFFGFARKHCTLLKKWYYNFSTGREGSGKTKSGIGDNLLADERKGDPSTVC